MIFRSRTLSVSKGYKWVVDVFEGKDNGDYQGFVRSVGGWAPDGESAKSKVSRKKEELQE